MGEHVHGLHLCHPIERVEQREVTCLSGRITTHVYDTVRCSPQNRIDNILVHTCTWRIRNDDIGPTMRCDKIIIEYILHVTRIEEGVRNTIEFRVDLGILDGLGHIFDTDDLPCLPCHEVGNGSCACLEVVNQLLARKSGKLAGHTIKVIGLLGIGLIETLGTYFEP